jgi:hypothetical protein
MEPGKNLEKRSAQSRAVELVAPEALPASASDGAEAPSSGLADIEEVFTAWASTRHHPNAVKLTAERRRLIARQLKHYPVGDLVAAVQGWTRSAFHRGENDQGVPYNDLDLILRDAAHIEKFRDLWRNGPSQPKALDRNAEMVRSRIAGHRAGQLSDGS